MHGGGATQDSKSRERAVMYMNIRHKKARRITTGLFFMM